MNIRFEINEIAYHINWKCEVRILSPLEFHTGLYDEASKQYMNAAVYKIEKVDNIPHIINGVKVKWWGARPEDLMKIPNQTDNISITWEQCIFNPLKNKS